MPRNRFRRIDRSQLLQTPVRPDSPLYKLLELSAMRVAEQLQDANNTAMPPDNQHAGGLRKTTLTPLPAPGRINQPPL